VDQGLLSHTGYYYTHGRVKQNGAYILEVRNIRHVGLELEESQREFGHCIGICSELKKLNSKMVWEGLQGS
jgi:hypothetical protein